MTNSLVPIQVMFVQGLSKFGKNPPKTPPVKTKKLPGGIFGGIFLKNSFSYDLDFTFMISSYGIDWEKSVLQNMSVNY